MENTLTQPQAPRRGLSASALKAIAIVAMGIDHAAWAFVPTDSLLGVAMHFVGRITAPVMFYLLVEGYYNTRNIFKYTRRMVWFALLSYLPFYYFEFGKMPSAQHFAPVGVIFTLLLGLLCLRALHEIQNKVLQVLAIAGLFLLSMFGDWPFFGVLYVLIFNRFRGNFKFQALGAGVLILVQCLPMIGSVPFFIMNLGQVLPLVLLYFYTGERGRGGKVGKWFFYIFYPAHLLVIGVIKWVVLQA